MITQDNRDNSSDDVFDKKIEKLKQLLETSSENCPNSSSSQKFSNKTPQFELENKNSNKEHSPPEPHPKTTQITVSGNNNIVSTKEIIVVQGEKKVSFWKKLFFSSLFF